MISKNQLKHIRALGQKKQRKIFGEFLVQGEKNVIELLKSNLVVKQVFATADFIHQYASELTNINTTEADIDSLTKVSTLVTNNSVIAVVNIPEVQNGFDDGLIIALDGVSDPGNLGTIIRVADWYGIKHIICSEDTADAYNPKTISATMGSFSRVNLCYTNLADYLSKDKRSIYGAFLAGDNVHNVGFSQDGILVMGSESHGIRSDVMPYVTNKVTIPNFGQAESLNVAMATGIILDNIKRS